MPLYWPFDLQLNLTKLFVCFQVTARGSPDMPLSWPFDLQLSLTKLMGLLCGATLNANPGKIWIFALACITYVY